MLLKEICYGLCAYIDIFSIVMLLSVLLGTKLKYTLLKTAFILLTVSFCATLLIYPLKNRTTILMLIYLVAIIFIDSPKIQSLGLMIPAIVLISLLQTVISAFAYITVGWKDNYANGVIISIITMIIFFSTYILQKEEKKYDYTKSQIAMINVISLLMLVLIGQLQLYLAGNTLLDNNKSYNIVFHNTLIGICILLCGIIAYLGIIQRRIDETRRMANEKEFLLKVEREQMEAVIKSEEKLRTFKHDLNAHLNALASYADDEDITRIKDYLSELIENNNSFNRVSFTGNTAVDGILNQLKSVADENGIELSINMTLQKEKNITDYDLCILISNILKNAIEASGAGGKVEINSWPCGDKICINSSNTSTHSLYYKKGVLLSTKRDCKEPGYGMRNIEAIIEKYDGDFQIREDSGIVNVEAMV